MARTHRAGEYVYYQPARNGRGTCALATQREPVSIECPFRRVHLVLTVAMLTVAMLAVAMLTVVMLTVVMLTVVMLTVVMLAVDCSHVDRHVDCSHVDCGHIDCSHVACYHGPKRSESGGSASTRCWLGSIARRDCYT